MMLRCAHALVLTATALLSAAACTSDDDAPGEGDDRSDAAAPRDAAASDAGACPEGASGSLRVSVIGLPSGLAPELELTGPDGSMSVEDGTTIADAASGSYRLDAERVLDDDPRVRALYIPTMARSERCVAADDEATFEVRYAQVATSNKLWASNDVVDANLLAVPSADLASGTPGAAGWAVDALGGNDIAFDRDGNLWTFGPTLAEPPIVRFAASSLRENAATHDRALELEGVGCIPAMRAMAFDASGNLWLSVCGGKVLRLTPAMLERGRTGTDVVTAGVEISGLVDNRDLAFDAAGNLWVTADGKITRYDAARLSSSDSAPPDASFTLRDADDSRDLGVDYLTFDEDGDLWATSFGSNFVAEIAKADLAGSDAMPLVAKVSIVISVTALLNRPAFDDEGGLWISYSSTRIARIAPAALTVSTGPGDPTAPEIVLEGGDIGSAGNVAFFPAAAGLPLYHAYP
jgi:streptogramin lyase